MFDCGGKEFMKLGRTMYSDCKEVLGSRSEGSEIRIHDRMNDEKALSSRLPNMVIGSWPREVRMTVRRKLTGYTSILCRA